MSDISHIQLGSDGEVYDIKDANAVRGIKINGSDVTASDSVVDLTQYGGYYGVCSTAAATAIKEVSCTGFELFTGAMITVKFTVTNSAAVADIKLDVNSTGAKSIKYRNANLSAVGIIAANRIYHFVYDGTYWQIIGDLDTNSNTYDRTSVQTRIYANGVGVFPYCICGLDKDQKMQAFTTTGGTGTSKAFNTSAKFLYPPTIMYHSANSTIASGSVIANNALYEQYPSVDLRYSTNKTSSSGFTQYKCLYIECTIDSDGLWSITSNGFVQTFTDGKYYILVGCMYNTSIYQLALFAYNPMFYYDGTNLVSFIFKPTDKTKLDGIATGATKVESSSTNGNIKINGTDTTVYTHPSGTSASSGLYKVAVDNLGHVSSTTAVDKADITALGIPAQDNDTKNTAGSTDTSSKIYLIGATSQAANPQTYSDNEVYTTSGALTTKSVSVGGGSCTLQYNTTTQSLDFVFT